MGQLLLYVVEDGKMTAENFEAVLDALKQLQPFRVFTVELHGGRRFEVDHPGALVVRDGVAVFLAPGGVPIWFDHESVNQIVGARANSQLDEQGARFVLRAIRRTGSQQ
jgi:hypothetical protein